jgi:hypothetical protein
VTCTWRSRADLGRAAILFIDLSAPPELKDLSRKRRSFLMKQKSDWKRITLLRKTSFKKEIKNIGR